jgi:hypothetical protein
LWTAEWDRASVRSSVGRPGKLFGGRTRFKALAPQALSIRPALGAVGLAPQIADRLKGRARARGRSIKHTNSAWVDENKSKQKKVNDRKNAFIYLHLFFRIGTFQWVTADSNKKICAAFCDRREMLQTHASFLLL